MMSMVRRSMDFTPSVRQSRMKWFTSFHRVFDVLAFDPVDHVDPFAGATGIHPDAADIAGAAKKACCI